MSLPATEEGALMSAAADAPRIAIDATSPSGGLLIISPLPDDETFGCGQALAAAAEAGRDCKMGAATLHGSDFIEFSAFSLLPRQSKHVPYGRPRAAIRTVIIRPLPSSVK